MDYINGIEWLPLLLGLFGIWAAVVISYVLIGLMRRGKTSEQLDVRPSVDSKTEASFSSGLGETLLGFLFIGIVIGFVKAVPEFTSEDWAELLKWGLVLGGVLLLIFVVLHPRKTLTIGALLALGIVLVAVLKWAFLFVFA